VVEAVIRANGYYGITLLTPSTTDSYEGEIRARTFREVMSLRSQLALESEILYLGYVPDEDRSGLYAGAAALVMPTFFGPTNIPVLEAWLLAARC